MMNYKKAKQMAVPSQNIEVDPRSKTTADGAFNYIPTGDKEKLEVLRECYLIKRKSLLGTKLCGYRQLN